MEQHDPAGAGGRLSPPRRAAEEGLEGPFARRKEGLCVPSCASSFCYRNVVLIHMLLLPSPFLRRHSSSDQTAPQTTPPYQSRNFRHLLPTAYFVSFGPHGPRAPLHPPGSTPKLLIGIAAALAASLTVFAGIRSLCASRPQSLVQVVIRDGTDVMGRMCSSGSASDDDQRVARGFDGDREGTEDGASPSIVVCMRQHL